MEIVLLVALGVLLFYGVYLMRKSAIKDVDVNQDGKVNVEDVKAAVAAVETVVKNDIAEVKASADLNQDGKVDTQDVKVAVEKAKTAVKKKKAAVVAKTAQARKKKSA